MKLYFDTNIYYFICKCDEADAVTIWLRSMGHRVTASGSNLAEMRAIPNHQMRVEQMRTLTAVATEFESLPDSYRQAREVLLELKRTHPAWIRSPYASEGEVIHAFLRASRDQWKLAKAYPGDKRGFAAYRRDAATADKDGQRRMRDAVRQFGGVDHPGLKVAYPAKAGLHLPNEELIWRWSGFAHWSSAIFQRRPSLRDYFDWLAPHLRIQSISMDDFVGFWLEEVDASQVPRTRIIGLTEYFQLKSRITPGNSQDMNHSPHLLDSDVFLTADQAFHRALSDVRARIESGALPVLVARQEKSALRAIQAALSASSSL